MADYNHWPWSPFENLGVDLVSAPNRVQRGRFRILRNLRSTVEGALQPRPGTARKNTVALAQLPVHTIGFLNDPVTPATLLYAGAGTALYNVATQAELGTGFSGRPLATVDYRLSGSSSAYAIIGDSNQMRKLKSDGTLQKLGISPPASAATSAAVAKATTAIETFDADVGFVYTNVAAHAAVGGKVGNALSVQTNVAVTATVSKVAALDLSTIGGLAATDDDYFHLWLNVDDPRNISEIRLLFDVDVDSVAAGAFTATAFTRNYYWKSIRGADIQAASEAAITSLTATQQAIERLNTEIAAARMQGIPVLGYLQAQLNQLEGLASVQTVTGRAQWTEFKIRRGDFTAIGGETAGGTRDWGDVVGFRVTIVTAAGVGATILLDDLYLFGGTGPDSSLGANYDWRHTYYNLVARSESNPSPVQASTTSLERQAATLTPTASADSQVDTIRWWRRGGTLADAWRLLGQQKNAATLTVTAASWAGGIATVTSLGHSFLAGQGVTVAGVNPAGYNGTFATTAVTADTFSYAVAVNPGAYVSGGTASFADISTDTAIASAVTLELTNDVPVTTVNAAGGTVYEQPLPFLWGPYAGTTIFGCGDPNRPGFVYWLNPTNPDGCSSVNNLEVTQASDPLQNGFIWAGQSFVFSMETLYQLLPTPIGTAQTFVAVNLQIGAGLFARWGLAASPKMPYVWFVSKDAVYEWAGGVAQPITADLWPLFHGQTAAGNAPIDFAEEARIRLAFFDGELRFTFQDTLGNVQLWICDLQHGHRWRQAAYPWSVYALYAQPETTSVLLMGGNNGIVYQEDEALTADDGSPLSCQWRTGSLDFDDPLADKEYGAIILDIDPKAASLVPTFLYDDEASSIVLPTQSGAGRQRVSLSVQDTYARSFALDVTFSSSVAPSFYGFEVLWRPDVVPLTHFESPASSFGLRGWMHLYDGYIGLRSTAPVQLAVFGDGVQIGAAITIPSTGGIRLKSYVQLPVNKFKVLQVKLDSASAFWLYGDDSFVNVMPWGGADYLSVRPFGIPLGV